MEKSNISLASPFAGFKKRFSSDLMAKIGLWGICFLLFIAIFAPLLANGRPIILYRNHSIEFPMLHFLFAPDSSEVIVEQTFNFLMLFLPIAAIIYFSFRKNVLF